MDRLTRMLTAQLEFQQKIGKDPTAIVDTADRAAWFSHMVQATIAELMEALNEVSWKSWAKSNYVNEDAAFDELRDAWQFLTNAMFVARQVSPEALAAELEEALYAKLKVNTQRHNDGYDGVSTKCPRCKRALDEVALTVVHMPNDVEIDKVLCVCGAQLTRELTEPYIRD